jgi:diphthamide biosynthesis protein 7
MLAPNTVECVSYDETIRLWDLRMLSGGVNGGRTYRRGATPYLAEAAVGGGVWRMCWHPNDPSLLAAAVMHGGVRILYCDISTPTADSTEYAKLDYAGLTVVEELRAGHESMAYGLSWAAPFGCSAQTQQEQASTPGLTATALASASFYDCSLNVWQPRARGKRSALGLNC